MATPTQIAFDFDSIPESPLPAQKPTVLNTTPIELPNTVSVALKAKSPKGRKSVAEINAGLKLVAVPNDEILFQKNYYSIGKVADMFKVNISLIRLWENEFDILKPKKNGKGNRLFRPEDIKNIHLIYHLMREKKYTMQGAKDFINSHKKIEEKFAAIDALKKIKNILIELKENL